MKQKKRKILKNIVRILTGMLMVLILLCVCSKVNHEIRREKEKDILDGYDMGQYVTIDGKKIHTCTMGNEMAENTIVYMHGLGMGDTSISTRPMFQYFKDDYKICIVDRLGNGHSDDSGEKQDIDFIVEEYRAVLNKTGQKAPYTLIAHSISGMYATYWAQQYPEEIKAIIYVDADPVENYLNQKKELEASLGASKLQYLLASDGLQRFLVSKDGLIGADDSNVYTEQEQDIRVMLMYQNTYSKATCQEMMNCYQNAKKVSEKSMRLDIPQLYISATKVDGKYYENIYKEKLMERFDNNQEKVESYIEEQNDIMNQKIEEMKQHGNMSIVQLSGPHCIYEYAPEQTAETILEFLNK